MVKWADYGISGVTYDQEKTKIVSVEGREDTGERIGSPTTKTRQNVIASIESGTTYVTILKNAEREWNKGANVGITTVNSVKYIRTDQNSTAADNLENLPEI